MESTQYGDDADWRVCRLAEVASIDRITVRPDQIHEERLYVGLEHMTSDGEFERVATAGQADLRSNKFAFSRDHVLFGKLRPYLAKIAAPDFDGICSPDILPIRPGPGLNRRYLLHYLRTPRAVAHAAASAVGINLPRLSPKVLESFDVPVPPIETQKRIVVVLDAANMLRTRRRSAIAKLDNLTRAVFMEMFGKNGWDVWGTATIAEVAASSRGSIRTGPFGSQLLHDEFVSDGPVAVLGIDNAVEDRFAWGQKRFITERKYSQLKRYTVHPGDVLVTIMGTCGRVAIVPDDIPLAINTKHLCCISLDRDHCTPEFLWACLRFHPGVRRQLGATQGAVMPGLNMRLIRQAEIPLPPIELQEIFAQWMKRADQQYEKSTTHLDRLEALFRSLQQQAFRGEL